MAPKHTKPAKNRRRKKRRTEDFSSDSDSLDSDSGSRSASKQPEEAAQQSSLPKEAININDIDIQSDPEIDSGFAHDTTENTFIPAEIKKKLDSVQFTSTEGVTPAEASDTLARDRKELESEFLAYMTTTFADDLDELRKKPDFTEKSLVILAKTLQSGSNMFDTGTLLALLDK